jgi:hypothetical protein
MKNKRPARKSILVRPFLFKMISDSAWRARMTKQDFLELLVLSHTRPISLDDEEENKVDDDEVNSGRKWLPDAPMFEDGGMFR